MERPDGKDLWISENVWWQMSDHERRRLYDYVCLRWYQSVGQFWTDEKWVSMLADVR